MASPRDYKNTIVPNWCPYCGDYGIQNAISAVCAKMGWPNESITLILVSAVLPVSAAISTATALIPPTAELCLLPRVSNVPIKIPI